jgi:hypothetical protein
MFRSEPAVAGLDGPFTPIRRLREGIVGHQLFGPPHDFRHASPYPRIDRPVSGRARLTPRA